MKSKAILLVVVVAAFIAGWLLSPSGNDHGEANGEPAASEASGETTWTCSMHPQVRQPDPGSCPICGMDLIPLTDDDEPDTGDLPQLRLSERAVALMNIRTVPVRRHEARAELRLPGRIEADETRLSVVPAWFSGRVDQLTANYTGTHVAKGDPVMEIYSPELFGSQEEYLQALRNYERRGDETSQFLLEGAREKLQLLGLSEDQIDEIERSGQPTTHLTFSSPASGFVLERQVTAGQYVQTGTPLYTLAELSQVWVELEAFESELELLRVGQPVAIGLTAFPGETFDGEIAFIDPEVNRQKRSARVRVNLANEHFRLKPGMLAVGTVTARVDDSGEAMDEDGGTDPLVVPATAPLFTGKRSLVYVRTEDADRPTFEARQVTLGRRMGEVYPVKDGLAEGDLVVVNGQFKIDSELQIRGRPSMMAPEGGDAPGHDHGDTAGQTHDGGAAAAEEDPREDPQRQDFADDVDVEFAAELEPLIDGYLGITEGLAADDLEAAADGLKKLHDQLLAIGQHRMSGDAHVAWMETYEEIHDVTHKMVDPASIENFRAHLQALTRLIESVHVNFGAGLLPVLNRTYCPMVDGDQIGTWLQRGDTVRNPYFGSSMLSCGDIFGQLGNHEAH